MSLHSFIDAMPTSDARHHMLHAELQCDNRADVGHEGQKFENFAYCAPFCGSFCDFNQIASTSMALPVQCMTPNIVDLGQAVYSGMFQLKADAQYQHDHFIDGSSAASSDMQRVAALIGSNLDGRSVATAENGQEAPDSRNARVLSSPSELVKAETGNSAIATTQPRRTCKVCGISDTPEWRRGSDGHKTLCNACGLRYRRRERNVLRTRRRRSQKDFATDENLENEDAVLKHTHPTVAPRRHMTRTLKIPSSHTIIDGDLVQSTAPFSATELLETLLPIRMETTSPTAGLYDLRREG